MDTLEKIRINNSIIAFCGINFIQPLFRKLAGQFPYDISTYTIYGSDEKKKQRKLKKIMTRDDDSFLLVVRGDKAELEEVVFIPSKQDAMEMVESK